MNLAAVLTMVTIIAATYAVMTAGVWSRRLMAEPASRRKGMALNFARRATPPVVVGALVLIVGAALGRTAIAPAGGAVIAIGLAVALHFGLVDVRQAGLRTLWPRLAITAAVSLLLIWQFGLL